MRWSITGGGSDEVRCQRPYRRSNPVPTASLIVVLLLGACASPRNPGVLWYDWSTWPSYQQGYQPSGGPAARP